MGKSGKRMLNNCKVVNTIYETRDYDIFKLLKQNRKLNPKNYTKLLMSMKEEQLQIPILVNKDFEVIDGQHRLACCKETGLPIYFYIVDEYTIEQVKRANMVSSNWTKEDFLNMHIENGIEAYMDIYNMIHLYGVNVSDLIKLFSLVQNTSSKLLSKNFEDGSFSLDGQAEVMLFLEALKDFSILRTFRTKAFINAFSKLYFHPDYNHSKMLERLNERGHLLTKRSTADEYLLLLTKDIYSFGITKRPIYYDINTKRFFN